jgi:hypothetical protein
MQVLNRQYYITQEFVDHLKAIFPDEVPRTPVTMERINYIQGNQQVIDYIQGLLNEDEQEG